MREVIPMLAAANSVIHPDASNAALKNSAITLSLATSIVSDIEKVSSGKTGVEKLELAQNAATHAHDKLVQAGITNQSFEEFWNPLNEAITVICAVGKTVKSGANNLGQITDGTVGQV